MEDDDNMSNLSNSFHDDGDHSRIVQQFLRSNISRKREESFWLYDIQNFPDSLLIEILARLPMKTIFMFKSVCKHWQSLISHPSFSRFYHSILNSNSNAAAALPFRFLHRYTRVPNLEEFVNRLDPEIHNWVLLLFTNEEYYQLYDQFRVLDISNGLILCCFVSPTPFIYYICDPLTRQYITIPRRGPNKDHYFFCEGLITRVNEDHMLTGYRVVRAEILDCQSNNLNLNIDMFSSETGKWIIYELSCVTPIQLCTLRGGPFHSYGALHWPVRRREYGNIEGMVAFDPYKDPKSVRLIPLPEDRDLQSDDNDDRIFQLCGESKGILRYFELGYKDPTGFYSLTMTMWTMKDYEKGEWCREFKVRRNDIHSSHLELSNLESNLERWFMPLSFHPSDPNVVYLTCMQPDHHDQCIVSYDVLNRRLDVACELIDFCQSIARYSVIPFVLPRWPVLDSIATVNGKIKWVKCGK